VSFSSLKVRCHKALRQALHPEIGMRLQPFRIGHIKFKKSVIGGTMSALTNVPHMNLSVSILPAAHSSSRKTD
jgi:hypothetical protein